MTAASLPHRDGRLRGAAAAGRLRSDPRLVHPRLPYRSAAALPLEEPVEAAAALPITGRNPRWIRPLWRCGTRRLDYELGPVRPFSYTPDALLKLSRPSSLAPRLYFGLAPTLSAVADVLGGAASPFKDTHTPSRGGAAAAASSSSSSGEPRQDAAAPSRERSDHVANLVGLCEPEEGVGYRFVKAWLPEKESAAPVSAVATSGGCERRLFTSPPPV